MLKILSTSVSLLLFAVTFGQASVNTSGGTVSNPSGSVSYSIGQVAYESISNASGSVSQGVQQAFEIATLMLTENTFNFSLTAFPNPTQSFLTLGIENFNQEKLTYQLVDLEGKLVQQGAIQSKETRLDMTQLPIATYFVEVNHEGKNIQTFKIIKNQ
jgi:hypothetical protein